MPYCLLYGQDTWYGGTSGMRCMYNPAFSGADGKSRINISNSSFFPGGGYKLNSVYASSEGYMPFLHGGTSLWAVNDFSGKVTNRLNAGVAYAYYLKAGNNLYFSAGLTASVMNISINRSAIIFPDDIDPYGQIINSSGANYTGKNITRFDIGTGFSVSSGKWYAGFAAHHLARPDMSDGNDEVNRLKRKFIFEGGAEFPAGSGETLIMPSFSAIVQGDYFLGCPGVNISLRQLYGGVSIWYIKDGFAAIQPSIGWRGNSKSIGLSYGYNLNLPENELPSTAVLRVSISFVINNVEKRNAIHIINLPEI